MYLSLRFLADPTSFSGWDFTTIWIMAEDRQGDEFPRLRWENQ